MTNEEEERLEDARDRYPQRDTTQPRCTSGMCGCTDCPVCNPATGFSAYEDDEN